jgi:flagellin
MVINTNIAATNGAFNLNRSTSNLNESLARLSSGSKIVNAMDDPAGLAESMSLTAQIGETNAANANVSNAMSFSQTQDGYLQQVSSALNQMAALAIAAQDPTKSTDELNDYNTQYTALAGYINAVATKQFNGVDLFSSTGLSVTTDSTGSTNAFSMTGVDLSSSSTVGLAAAGSVKVDNATNASTALGLVQSAITALATSRASVGANQERLTYTGNELGVLSNNLAAANSVITDVDVAQESTNYAKYQILVQSGTAMLAQANQNPQSVLKLIQ